MVRIFLIILFFMTLSFAGNFEEGMSAYNAGDYEKAKALLMETAKQNNRGAQFTLGAIYGNDIGVVQSNIFAYALFGLASKNGDSRGKEMQSRVVDWLTPNEIKTAQSLVDNPAKLWAQIEKIESKKKK
jgi:TPR repeat protein